ncbi:hypothetical protein RchiOBHm_Chr7g0215471 [Rosa chinensis]|uniref:Uncharacterized protein n=1 Tax=Rosa chinensis TaxID=74649 RepID=A0A2P6PBH7_ROSCH|nr:hypothetical protein RchiOBHm_Chr7g0215471 [Rosa chinensis]
MLRYVGCVVSCRRWSLGCCGDGRRRVPYTCKWSLPLSSRVKLSVTGCSVRGHHDGKVVRMEVMLCCSLVVVQVILLLCHRCVKAVKANRVAICALFASWCFVEYKRLVETQDSISGGSTYCNQGCRLNVPPPPCIRQFL